MSITVTLGWWMLPLAIVWAFMLYACARNYDDSAVWLGTAFVGGFLTVFALLTRFLP